jgi:hypothetical protein
MSSRREGESSVTRFSAIGRMVEHDDAQRGPVGVARDRQAPRREDRRLLTATSDREQRKVSRHRSG